MGKIEELNAGLLKAVQSGDIEAMQLLINAGVNVDQTISDGWTALLIVAHSGQAEAINVLLQAGANINQTTPDGWTALHVAVQYGHAEAINVLLQAGANINQTTPDGRTALHVAVQYGHAEAINVLLQAGANIILTDGSTVLHVAAQQGQAEAINVLLQAGAKINQTLPNGGRTALHLAAQNGHIEVIRLLLDAGADANKKTSGVFGKSPMKLAKKNNQSEAVSLLETHLRQYPKGVKRVEKTQSTSSTTPIASKRESRSENIDEKSVSKQASLPSLVASNITSTGSQTSSSSQLSTTQSKITHIAPKDFTQQQKLGEGAYGIVYKGEWQTISVAIKQLKLTELPETVREAFEAEASVMANLRFTHVVQFFGVCMENPYSIIMEYCAGGSLYSYLHSNNPLKWNQRYSWGSEIGKGLNYLHSQNVLHRDLKSLNVLLNKHQEAKLTDFGLAKVKSHVSSMTAKQTSANPKGTLAWMAPELTDMEPEYSHASDVYAYGMVLFELATREVPFHQAANPALIPMWVAQEKRPKIPDDCPKTYADLMTKCWAQRANARPTAQEVVKELQSQVPTSPRAELEPRTNNTQVETMGYASQPMSRGYQ